MLQRRFILTEYIYAAYFLIQSLNPDAFNLLSAIVLFAVVALHNWYFDGFRVTFLVAFILEFLILLIPFTIVRLIFTALMILFLWRNPVFKRPDPTGKYLVGYKTITINGPKGPTSVGVYYPTTEKTKDVKYAPTDSPWLRYAEVIKFFAQLDNGIVLPKFVVWIIMNIIEQQYLGMNEDAKMIKLEGNQNGHPVIVFSHGLSANIHIYSVMLKEWASHGFVVFSMDHDELVYINIAEYGSYENHLPARNLQLNVRKKTVCKVFDIVYDTDYVQKLFGDQTVKFNYDKIFLAGHSFGGGTAAEAACEDNRITGGLLLLDPWLEPADENVLYKPVSVPIMSLRSDTCDKVPKMRERIVKHVEANKKNNKEILSGFFKESGHSVMADIALFTPRKMADGQKVKVEEIGEQLVLHILLTRLYFETALKYDAKTGEGVPALTLKRFREEIKKLGKEDKLFVDA